MCVCAPWPASECYCTLVCSTSMVTPMTFRLQWCNWVTYLAMAVKHKAAYCGLSSFFRALASLPSKEAKNVKWPYILPCITSNILRWWKCSKKKWSAFKITRLKLLCVLHKIVTQFLNFMKVLITMWALTVIFTRFTSIRFLHEPPNIWGKRKLKVRVESTETVRGRWC